MKSVNCPKCLKTVPWNDESPFRPFCSERCKLIDLGDWATGKHAIAGEPVSESDEAQLPVNREDYLDY